MKVNLRKLFGRYGCPIDLVKQIAAYRSIPQIVLADLADCCGAADPAPTDGDLFKQGRAAGRRDIWLRIQYHLALNEHELFALLKGQPLTTRQE